MLDEQETLQTTLLAGPRVETDGGVLQGSASAPIQATVVLPVGAVPIATVAAPPELLRDPEPEPQAKFQPDMMQVETTSNPLGAAGGVTGGADKGFAF